jgi:hypothetical protein
MCFGDRLAGRFRLPHTTVTSRPSLTSASSIIASDDQLPTLTV